MLGLCLAVLSVCVGAEPPAAPVFTLHSAAETADGPLQQLDRDWSVTLGNATKCSGADLLSLRRKDRLLPPFPAGPHLLLANGDRLPGDVLTIEKDHVRFRIVTNDEAPRAAGQELSVPIAAVAEIWFQSPPDSESARAWAGDKRRRDIVLLNNGDTRSGTVLSMKPPAEPFRLKEGAQETRIEPHNIVAIALNTDLARSVRPKAPYARLVLANGARLSLQSAEANEHALTGKTLFGAEIRVPIEQIVALDVRQGKVVYLSDLKPKKYEHIPYLGVKWNYEPDRSVAGRELRVAGNTFDKGIGLHSESRLTFALNGDFRRFEALVGLDDRTGQGGSVSIRVFVDGQEKAIDDKELTAATGPRPLRIDVAGAKELTLVVEFGAGGDVCDHVDWADAKLVK